MDVAACSVGIQIGVTIGILNAVVINQLGSSLDVNVRKGQVPSLPLIISVRRVLLVFNLNALLEVHDQGIAYVATRAGAEEHTLLSGISTSANHGPVRDGWKGEWHAIRCHVRAVVSVQLTSAVTSVSVVDREPVVSTAGVALVPVEAVVAYKGHSRVVDFNGSTKELDAIVIIRQNFHVIYSCAASDASERQTVDFVCSSELCSTVADAHVGDNTRVVRCVRSTVLGAVVIRRDAFYLAFTGREIGGSVTANNHTAPLAACIVCH